MELSKKNFQKICVKFPSAIKTTINNSPNCSIIFPNHYILANDKNESIKIHFCNSHVHFSKMNFHRKRPAVSAIPKRLNESIKIHFRNFHSMKLSKKNFKFKNYMSQWNKRRQQKCEMNR